MAQSLRQIKARARSVENIGKVTAAMEMVSSARLRSVQKKIYAFKEYFPRLEKLLNDLLASFPKATHSLFEAGNPEGKTVLCIISSDTGLCGTYNTAIFRVAERFISENKNAKISLVIVGRKALSYFKKRDYEIRESYLDLFGHYSSETADRIMELLMGMFLSGEAGEVYVAYTGFISAGRNLPQVEKILNIAKKGGISEEYILEPDINAILADLVPVYLKNKMRAILLDSFCTEHSVRMVAMHEATDNARDLLDGLVILRNKMRQAEITTELIEVLSSVSAMKG